MSTNLIVIGKIKKLKNNKKVTCCASISPWLRNYDLPEAREALVQKSLSLTLKEWLENRHVYENYNADTGVGGDVRNGNAFYSWGGLLAFIALMDQGYFID